MKAQAGHFPISIAGGSRRFVYTWWQTAKGPGTAVWNAEISDTDKPESPASGKPVRHTRRLFDKILVSFHHACDIGDLEIASQLLPLLESMTTRRQRVEDGNRRRSIEGLVAAHERLWHLRHPNIR